MTMDFSFLISATDIPNSCSLHVTKADRVIRYATGR